jgi:hypothetical protein
MVKVIVTVFVTMAMIAALVAAGAVFVTTKNNTAACEAANDIRLTLTKIITRSQTLASSNPDYTEAEKNTAALFYTQTLKELKVHNC